MWAFLYVGEVVRALMLIDKRGRRDIVYGIGSGKYHSLREYIECIRDIIDPGFELGIGDIPAMSEKAFSSCVNIYDLVRNTGFKVQVSFEEGIQRMIEWKRKEIVL